MTSVPSTERATAILRLSRARGGDADVRPLDPDREYILKVELDGREIASGAFRSPLGDERWREVVEAMRRACSQEQESRHDHAKLFAAGVELYRAVVDLSPDLHDFLARDTGPRRLVVASDCAEIHSLPWEAMVSDRKVPLAAGDLSVVRAARYTFDTVRQVSAEELRLDYLLGPDTPATTLGTLEEIAGPSRNGARRGLRASPIETGNGRNLRDALSESKAEIIHVEAHGDHLRQVVDLVHGTPTSLVEAAQMIGSQRRLLVLFWTCFSGMTHASGDSLGRLLHDLDANLVLGFVTPLRFDDAGGLASKFYQEVLDPRTGGDVESVLVSLRRRQVEIARLRCVWASLTVWLRRPIDLTPALRVGPRLPDDAWSSQAAASAGLGEILRNPVPGWHVVDEPLVVPSKLAAEILRNTRGAAIRLDGAIDGESRLDAILRACCPDAASPSQHPADRLCALLPGLAAYRESLLLWSNVTSAEETFFELYDHLPRNLAVVLVKQRRAECTEPAPEGDLHALQRCLDRGDLLAAVERWRALDEDATRWNGAPPDDLRSFLNAGYWAMVKTNEWVEAERCATRMAKAAERYGEEFRYGFEFEANLLRGNYEERVSCYDRSRRFYLAADELAVKSGSERDRGRLLLESAYLERELGDRSLAERLYQDALHRLERWSGPLDRVWRSSLGRALRDYADLLATDADRTSDARALLRRAIAVHALDGRFEQLAPSLRTRGLVEETEARFDLAEASYRAAAARCASFGNSVGCVDSLLALARLACARGRLDQSLAVLDGLVLHLEKQPPERDRQRSRVAAQRAQVLWAMGRTSDSLAAADLADGLLPPISRERAPLRDLRDVIHFLGAPVRLP